MVLTLYLFTREKYPLEITSLALLALLAVGFSVFPYEHVEPTSFFYGLGHEALVAVCALMVIGQGMVVTGALEPVGRILARVWSVAPFLSFAATLIVGAFLSAFVNNTPIVVLLLPILISVCLRTDDSAPKILMPMGFATLVGGMATTIGTSTNLLVVSVSADLGGPRFEMFDFALPATIAAAVAILYLWIIAPKLLKHRELQLDDASPRVFAARLALDDSSPAIGKTLAEALALVGGEVNVVRIRRGDSSVYAADEEILRAGDRLRVQDTTARIRGFAEALKATLYSGDHIVDDDHPFSAENQSLAEIAIVQGSALDRTNLKTAHFLDRYQLLALALHRHGKDVWKPHEEIGDVLLAQGDVLLVQGPREEIGRLKSNGDFLVLDATVTLPRTEKAPVALAIMIAVVAFAATGVMPIAVSATAGAVAMLLTGCLGFGASVRAISPSVFFVVVASLALGKALVDTGATQYLTDVFLYLTAGSSPTVVMSALMLLLAVLTNVVSNNAAAVIGTPIAIGIAAQLGLPAEPFVLAVLFGANMSYATPMAYKTNLLVMSAGGYRFSEFVKVGVPLTLIMWVVLSWILAEMYF
ncbi:MAG: SLC13 family permease [Gammaproteobacteria bacterium]|nr:SLC13 family permease [Gammaproteobacteria bacterium]